MSARCVRIPRSATTRTASGYAKLLTHVEPTARTGFDFQGTLIPTGALVTEDDLWPTPDHPRPALLLEHVGNPKPARGHNRSGQGDVWVLWRYRPGAGAWEEVARCCMVGDSWAMHLAPLAAAALAEARGPQPLTDTAAVQARIAEFLDAELRGLNPQQTERVLAAVHDQLASRICGAFVQRAA